MRRLFVAFSPFFASALWVACVSDTTAGGDAGADTGVNDAAVEAASDARGPDASDAGDAGPIDAGPCLVDASGPYLVDAVDVSVGLNLVCAVRQTGRVACFGKNINGSLGPDAGTSYGPVEVPLPQNVVVTHVSVGVNFGCALDTNQHVWCWGTSNLGQAGSLSQASAPAVIKDGTSQPIVAVEISALASTACALTSTGDVLCWGDNKYDLLDSPDAAFYSATATKVSNLSIPGGHLAHMSEALNLGAHTASTVTLWGGNEFAQCALPATISTFNVASAEFLNAGVSLPLRDLSGASDQGGHDHMCAVDATGKLFCWGDNGLSWNGSLPNTPNVSVVPETADASVVSISAGARVNCFVDTSRRAWCMGSDQTGQLGNGTTAIPSPSPQAVQSAPPDGGDAGTPLTSVAMIRSGAFSSCAIVATSCGTTGPGALVCWGDNSVGELGQGTVTPNFVPWAIPVKAP